MSDFLKTVGENPLFDEIISHGSILTDKDCCLCWATLRRGDNVSFVYRGILRRAHIKCLNVELVKLRLDGKN